MSVCEVTSPTTYENRAPKTGGLLDLRMGTIARDHRCLTCQGSMVCMPHQHRHIDVQPNVAKARLLAVVLRR